MVSVTVDVVVVFEVMDPWVKLGTTGTATAVLAFARTYAPTIRTSIRFITHDYLICISVTNCPVAEVPAPPAVRVVTPAEVIVPARVPATPPDIVNVSP